MALRVIRYVAILFVLYLFWLGFFPYDTMSSQLAFNFAVFYPLGMISGYRFQKEYREAVVATILFNTLSYILVLALGASLPSILQIIFDYLFVLSVLFAGILVGSKSAKQK